MDRTFKIIIASCFMTSSLYKGVISYWFLFMSTYSCHFNIVYEKITSNVMVFHKHYDSDTTLILSCVCIMVWVCWCN